MPSNLKQPRLVDRAYRKSAQHRHCMVRHPETGEFCNQPPVLAHIRIGGNAGTNLKPSDDESLFLCTPHHDEFDLRSDPWMSEGTKHRLRMEWLVRNVYIPERKAAYRKYRSETGR